MYLINELKKRHEQRTENIALILDTNPTLATTKSNVSEHGMGISNTRSLVSSINGIMNFAEEGNSFFAQIIIQNYQT